MPKTSFWSLCKHSHRIWNHNQSHFWMWEIPDTLESYLNFPPRGHKINLMCCLMIRKMGNMFLMQTVPLCCSSKCYREPLQGCCEICWKHFTPSTLLKQAGCLTTPSILMANTKSRRSGSCFVPTPKCPLGYVVLVSPPYSHSAARDAHLLLLDTASVQREHAAPELWTGLLLRADAQ